VLAETLFREGKELMVSKQFGAACPKLAESYRLDSGTGTLLALALCHEGEGRLATAWVEFTDVVAATAEARPDRALVAREHLATIEPQLSRLTVVVPASLADAPGLEIVRDDVRLARPAWGTPVPIDGGAHTLEARATSRRPWELHFDVAPTGERRVVEVPLLVPDETPPTAPPSTSILVPAPIGVEADGAKQRWGLVLGAAGVIGVGVGTYFGVEAITKIHDAKSQCPAGTCASQSSIDTNAQGLRDATIADVALGAGLVAGAVGIFLVLSGRAQPTTTGLRITPSIDRYGASLTLGHSL
jgi:hypothetical protein